MDDTLRSALHRLSQHAQILIATDFDGVLAPLVDDPSRSAPVDGAMDTLAALAQQQGVTVAVVSGRDLATLSRLSGAAAPVELIGSHGAESTRRRGQEVLERSERDRLDALVGDVGQSLADHPEARLEHKPAGVALHTRGMDQPAARAAVDAVSSVADQHDELWRIDGKDVLELAVTEITKGSALLELAGLVGADATIYLGDDATDERAFAVLGDLDVTVKVGQGPTLAAHRVPDEPAVLEVLNALLDDRQARVTDVTMR